MMIVYGLLALALLTIVTDLWALASFKPAEVKTPKQQWPKVSVLVPMRDEADNAKELVASLQQLDYPPGLLEFLIGEDRSTDETPAILRELAERDARISVISIDADLPNLVAKANVVAQLIPHCTSEYYFITDADVRLPAHWIKTLLSGEADKAGVIGGSTVVRVRDFWSGLQNLDWIFAQGLLSAAGKIYQVVAVSGTNMMITGSVCRAIGGYHKIPYSLTEDIGVLTAARKAGFSGKNIISPGATAVIEAQPDLKSLVSQRSRWTYGVMRLPNPILTLLFIRVMFLVVVIMIAWWHAGLAIAIYLGKSVLDLIFIKKVAGAMGQRVALKHFLIFEVYWFLMAVSGLLKYLFSSTKWKGRKYL